MRYRELIEGEYYEPRSAEARKADEDYLIKQIVKHVSRDCKPFLEHIDGKIGQYDLLRGLGEADKQGLFKKTARLNDRKPTDTSQEKHDSYNDYFEREFGHPYRNGVFASGDYGQAASYGNVYVIYPIGDFKFIWSPEVNDMAFSINWPTVGGFSNVPPAQEVVDNILSKAGYTTGHLKEAIDSGYEIMLWCKEYYAVKYDMVHTQEFSAL